MIVRVRQYGNHCKKNCRERCNKAGPMMNVSKCDLIHVRLALESFLKFLFLASLSSFVTFISVINISNVYLYVINFGWKSITQPVPASVHTPCFSSYSCPQNVAKDYEKTSFCFLDYFPCAVRDEPYVCACLS